MSLTVAMLKALIIGRFVASFMRQQNSALSTPCSWIAFRPKILTLCIISSSVGFTNTPTLVHSGRYAGTSVTQRLEPSQNMKPIISGCTSSSTARMFSGSRIPQTLILNGCIFIYRLPFAFNRFTNNFSIFP